MTYARSTKLPTWAKAGIIAGSCAAVVSAGAALAYLSDTESLTNSFTVADQLNITLREPAWEGLPDENDNGVPDEVEAMVPTQTVKKDPHVENTSGTSAWIAARVSVPVASVKTVLDDGSIESQASLRELFTYTLNEGWTEQGQPELSADGAFMVHTYLADAMVVVGGQTPAIFNEVQLINLADEQFSGSTHIDVDAFGIQTYGFDTARDAWEAYQRQNA